MAQAYSAVCGLRVAESDDVRVEAPKDVPLLLLCAEDSEVALVQLLDALNRGGRAPEVIAGVESDASLLSAAADRMRGVALFVLCQSGDLDRSQVLRLEGLFSARKGPLHQLLVVELDEAKPLEALPTIEAAMMSIAHASPASSEGGERHVPKREVIAIPGELRNQTAGAGPRSDAAEPLEVDEDQETGEIEVLGLEEAERLAQASTERKAREEAEALARAFHEEMLAAEAMLERRRAERREPERADIPSRVRRPIVDQLDIGIPQHVGGDSNAQTRPLDLDVPVAIGLGEHEPPAPPPEPRDEDEDELGLLSSSLANVRVAEPLTPEVPTPEAIQTELTPTDTRPRRRDPEESDTSSPTQHLEEAESRRGWLLAAVGAVALGGVALFVMQGNGEVAPRSAAATASTAPRAVPPITSNEPPTEARPPTRQAPVVATPDPEPDAEFEPDAIEPDPEPQAVKPTPSGSVPPPPVDSEALRIDDAIRSGKVRALDALLVARPGADAVDWSAAKSSCRRKRVAGLPGWRLPSRNELSRLRRSRMLDEGTFWSRDRGPHDDDAYAVVAASGATNVYLQVEPAAKVQCVRKR